MKTRETIRRVLYIMDRLEKAKYGLTVNELSTELETSVRQIRKYLAMVEEHRPLVHDKGNRTEPGIYYLLK